MLGPSQTKHSKPNSLLRCLALLAALLGLLLFLQATLQSLGSSLEGKGETIWNGKQPGWKVNSKGPTIQNQDVDQGDDIDGNG